MLAAQDKVTECDTGWRPKPESDIVAGEFVALVVTVPLPVALPVAAGAKITCRVAVCPGVRMSPAGTPPALKPGPETLTLEMVTLEWRVWVYIRHIAVPGPELLARGHHYTIRGRWAHAVIGQSAIGDRESEIFSVARW